MDLHNLSDCILKAAICQNCKSPRCRLSLLEVKAERKGLAQRLVLRCNMCQNESSFSTSSKAGPNKPFDINVKTGEVLDYAVKTKYCQKCVYHEKQKKSKSCEKWMQRNASECCMNHKGTSDSMETAGATEMFLRSIETRSLRYATFVGDGDTDCFGNVADRAVARDIKLRGCEFSICRLEKQIQSLLTRPGETLICYAAFPRIGCQAFIEPIDPASPEHNTITRSLYYPDETIHHSQPRFARLQFYNDHSIGLATHSSEHWKPDELIYIHFMFSTEISVKVFATEEAENRSLMYQIYQTMTERGQLHRYLIMCTLIAWDLAWDALVYRWISQAFCIEEATVLYDQLIVLAHIMLSLSAASPAYRGTLVDLDCRWSIISGSVDDRTREELGEVDAIRRTLEESGLSLKKIIGIGVDGCSTMVGIHHSMSTYFKNLVSEIVIFKCVCHSLQLAASKAADVMPDHLDFMVSESYNLFAHSTKRLIGYKELHKTITNEIPNKLLQLSATRWMSRYECIRRIIDQWEPLMLCFRMAASGEEKCYTARQLSSMFQDSRNYVYLVFLEGVLKDFSRISKLFEIADADVVRLGGDLLDFYQPMLQQVVIPSRLQKVKQKDIFNYDSDKDLMPVSCIHFGYAFISSAERLNILEEDIKDIKERCLEFLVKAIEEVQQRIPENATVFQAVASFSPKEISQMQDLTKLAKRFKNISPDIDAVNKELRQIKLIDVPEKLKDDPVKFLSQFKQYKDAAGECRFNNVAELALMEKRKAGAEKAGTGERQAQEKQAEEKQADRLR
eukprot:gene12318-13588_t